jgi:hypothetical protein
MEHNKQNISYKLNKKINTKCNAKNKLRKLSEPKVHTQTNINQTKYTFYKRTENLIDVMRTDAGMLLLNKRLEYNLNVICLLPSKDQAHIRQLFYSSDIMTLQSFVWPWPLFQFLNLYTVGRTPWTRDQPVARPLPTHRTTQTQNKRTQTSMPRVGFEPTTSVFERAKTVHALDLAATVIRV